MESPITPTEPVTRVAVEIRDGRHQVRASPGLLRAQRLHGPDDRARVALVAQTALLLGGDRVDVEIEVGSGAVLELSDIAGTVAYHGRGRLAAWRTAVRLGRGAHLRYAGQPLVIGAGADVTRTLTVDLAADATARLRETVVFGRVGEVGGRLDTTTRLRRAGEEFCRERLYLDPGARDKPGILAGVRVVDTVLDLGLRANVTSYSVRSDVVTYALLDEESTLTRFLGTSAADSPLISDWSAG